jgi:polygalacturonase
MRQRCLRFGFTVIALTAILVAFGESRMQPKWLLAAGLTNLGRDCYNVLDFGADPTGLTDSTPAFQAALQSASVQNGVAVCAPAGLSPGI